MRDGLASGFPDDFSPHLGLEVIRSTPLGQRYIIQAASEGLPSDMVAFYAAEVTNGRATGDIVMAFEALGDDEHTAVGIRQ